MPQGDESRDSSRQKGAAPRHRPQRVQGDRGSANGLPCRRPNWLRLFWRDWKARRSRRTPAMPRRCAEALKLHRERQDVARKAAGVNWQANDLVFASKAGTELGSHNVWRSFRAVLKKAGLNTMEWTPREMRHSFVSPLSDSGIPLENISRLVGHRNTSVTEIVYRKQLRPMLLEGAEAMDRIFPNS
ncbi:tyrosine-type recombinase/integrase [Streptosporangium sp. NPDC006013]|uniref:tyrosine-type recombinase/integrase n=1 Tax=Streptosporangium sp. NPDC006013 TaxID=3155596 RepID=UPI0033BFB29E